MSERPAMTADEMAGWKTMLGSLSFESKRTAQLVESLGFTDFWKGREAARQCARDAVAARIAAMAQEEKP